MSGAASEPGLAGNVHESSCSLQFELILKTVGFEPTTQMVQYSTLTMH